MMPDETLLAHDRLALFGFGVFETLYITEKGPLFVDLHWQRMYKGAVFLGLKLPEKGEWLSRIREFISQSSGPYPYALRVTLSGGAPLADLPPKLLLHKRTIPYISAQYEQGIRLHILPAPRNEQSPLVSIKSANYLENLLAKEVAKLQGAEEGLWLNTKKYITEGTMSNIFFAKDGTLFTPSLECGCLPGTRRQLILDLAQSLQIPTHEGQYILPDLLSADEIFMTNSLMGIMPVCQVDAILFNIDQKSLMKALDSAYRDLIDKTSAS